MSHHKKIKLNDTPPHRNYFSQTRTVCLKALLLIASSSSKLPHRRPDRKRSYKILGDSRHFTSRIHQADLDYFVTTIKGMKGSRRKKRDDLLTYHLYFPIRNARSRCVDRIIARLDEPKLRRDRF